MVSLTHKFTNSKHSPFTSLLIPYFQKFKFVKVCSLVGMYFHTVYIVNKFESVFSLNIKDNTIGPV